MTSVLEAAPKFMAVRPPTGHIVFLVPAAFSDMYLASSAWVAGTNSEGVKIAVISSHSSILLAVRFDVSLRVSISASEAKSLASWQFPDVAGFVNDLNPDRALYLLFQSFDTCRRMSSNSCRTRLNNCDHYQNSSKRQHLYHVDPFAISAAPKYGTDRHHIRRHHFPLICDVLLHFLLLVPLLEMALRRRRLLLN